jgi:hypothetical protein
MLKRAEFTYFLFYFVENKEINSHVTCTSLFPFVKIDSHNNKSDISVNTWSLGNGGEFGKKYIYSLFISK